VALKEGSSERFCKNVTKKIVCTLLLKTSPLLGLIAQSTYDSLIGMPTKRWGRKSERGDLMVKCPYCDNEGSSRDQKGIRKRIRKFLERYSGRYGGSTRVK